MKLLVRWSDHPVSNGIVLCTEDGQILPGLVKVTTVNEPGALPLVVAEFYVDGSVVAWDAGTDPVENHVE